MQEPQQDHQHQQIKEVSVVQALAVDLGAQEVDLAAHNQTLTQSAKPQTNKDSDVKSQLDIVIDLRNVKQTNKQINKLKTKMFKKKAFYFIFIARYDIYSRQNEY